MTRFTTVPPYWFMALIFWNTPMLILIKDLLQLRSKFKKLVTGRLDEGAKIVAEDYDTPWKSMVFLN